MEWVDFFLQQLITGLSNGMIIALIAIGYTMVYGIIELINFAHGDLCTLGAFLALTIAVSNIKTLLNTGNKVGGISSWMPFPPHQTEYVLQPPIQSYQSVWNTQEQQTSQYSSVVTKYARLLLDTPNDRLEVKQGHRIPDRTTVHAHCSSVVPRGDEPQHA
jgi:hypothetical protein